MTKCTQETSPCQVRFLQLLWSILFDMGFHVHKPPCMRVHHLECDFIDFKRKEDMVNIEVWAVTVLLSLQSLRELCWLISGSDSSLWRGQCHVSGGHSGGKGTGKHPVLSPDRLNAVTAYWCTRNNIVPRYHWFWEKGQTPVPWQCLTVAAISLYLSSPAHQILAWSTSPPQFPTFANHLFVHPVMDLQLHFLLSSYAPNIEFDQLMYCNFSKINIRVVVSDHGTPGHYYY